MRTATRPMSFFRQLSWSNDCCWTSASFSPEQFSKYGCRRSEITSGIVIEAYSCARPEIDRTHVGGACDLRDVFFLAHRSLRLDSYLRFALFYTKQYRCLTL